MYQMNIKDSDISEIKKIIKPTIIQKGLSIDDVADMTGYSKQTLYNFFSKDTKPSRFLIFALLETLGIERERP
jgi:transcriptional regulator with XRE-family HTH domain